MKFSVVIFLKITLLLLVPAFKATGGEVRMDSVWVGGGTNWGLQANVLEYAARDDGYLETIDDGTWLKNICPSVTSCSLRLGIRLVGSVGTVEESYYSNGVKVTGLKAGMKYTEVRAIVNQQIPVRLSVTPNIQIDPRTWDVCLDLAPINSTNGINAVCGAGMGIPQPPLPGPDPVTCSSPAPIYLNHGDITADELEGHKAAATARISCTGATSVRVYAKGMNGTSVVPIINGVTSRLSVNDVDGATGAVVKISEGQEKEVVVTSTLQGTPVDVGPFKASGTLTIDVL